MFEHKIMRNQELMANWQRSLKKAIETNRYDSRYNVIDRALRGGTPRYDVSYDYALRMMYQMVRDGKLWISRGASVAVFPEGTRSKDGEIHRFKAGAFTLAREAGVEILPVVLDGTKTLIRKNAMFNWGNRITIRVLPPVPAAKVVSTETHVLMEEVHDAMSAALAQIRNRK